MYFSTPLVFVCLASIAGGITVGPCPTNKVAPDRRVVREGRTFGHFASLFSNDDPENAESPADDCDDIEDYNDSDLSSLTPPNNIYTRKQDGDGKFFFNFFKPQQGGQNTPTGITNPVRPERPPGPVRPPHRPPEFTPQRPTTHRPTIPPFTRTTRAPRPPPGGYFGSNNYYNPGNPEYPSDNVKPVNEAPVEEPFTYRPHLTSRPTSTRPINTNYQTFRPTTSRPSTYYNTQYTSTNRPETYYTQTNQLTNRPLNYYYTSTKSTVRPPCYYYTTACAQAQPQRDKRVYSNSIIGSFFDLVFN